MLFMISHGQWYWNKQESLTIAKTTARCAQYMGPMKSFQSSQTPPATFPEICDGLMFQSILRMCIQNVKFVALHALSYSLPQTVCVCLHSNFSGELRKTISFRRVGRFGARCNLEVSELTKSPPFLIDTKWVFIVLHTAHLPLSIDILFLVTTRCKSVVTARCTSA